MRQVLAKGLLAAAATTGVLGVTGGTAFADAGASGESANSPGVLSGNNVHAPVEVPANICGNSADVVGALNPSFGNGCASDGGGGHHSQSGQQTQGGQEQRSTEGGGQEPGEGAGEGAGAAGSAQNSPGVGSGNDAKAPVDVPVNACGNTADIVGLLNPVFGNDCAGSKEQEHADDSVPQHVTPEAPRHVTPEAPRPAGPGDPRAGEAHDTGSPVTQLAHTGTQQIGFAAGTGAALVLGGAILYRRARPGRR